jgi:hypothetical protein
MMSLFSSWNAAGSALGPGNLLKSISRDVLPSISGLIGAASDRHSRMAAIGAQNKASAIAAARGQIDILKKRASSLDRAMGEYGTALVAGARAGGVMPSYYGPIWKGLADDAEDANVDYGAIQFRHSMERANFAAQRAMVRLQFVERLTDGIFGGDWFDGGHSSMNGGRRSPR